MEISLRVAGHVNKFYRPWIIDFSHFADQVVGSTPDHARGVLIGIRIQKGQFDNELCEVEVLETHGAGFGDHLQEPVAGVVDEVEVHLVDDFGFQTEEDGFVFDGVVG